MFESIESTLYPIVCNINTYLSNYILVFLLLGVGLWYSIKTRFVQLRCFKEGWNSVFGNLSLRGKKHDSGMSSFQALATAIAAQVGTGNIVGASGAILTGGPGAIFWMWLIAFFGMATIYAEATLAQETRIVEKDGNVKGGPVYYITTAFKGGFGKFLAGFFAVAIILALGFFGCMVQSNSIGETFSNAFNVPTWIIGVVLVAICGFIFLGGVQRLASVTEKIVPIMAAVFLAGGLIVLIARIKYVPATFGMIFKYAFVPQSIIGGGIGGMECALVLKKRGHTPVIFEKSGQLGGLYITAAAMSFKEADKALLRWYERELKKNNIEVRFHMEINAPSTLRREFDEVIVCTGSAPKTLPVKGFNKTINFTQLLLNQVDAGDRIVFFGGGQSSCEAAYEMVLQGKHPIIVEYADDLIATPGTCLANASFLREMLAFKKVPVYLNSTITEIDDGFVMVKGKDGQTQRIDCDSVVNGIGFVPAPIAPDDKKVHRVGTCEKWGNLRNVTWGAWDVCMNI